ncbi:hypothetical protein [Halobaculum limi]|uniref:hypothetical protein n=1 Tax=Halobaculum limi TaxID=3031916 RepID=UPI002405EE85|nr:hypothetical protein [Halobaculum sp. YSMS11]
MSDTEAAGEDNGETADGAGDDAAPTRAESTPETAPEVELTLYQVNVRVKGQADDDLSEVEQTATRLIDHLVDRAGTLEEEPDKRGLS